MDDLLNKVAHLPERSLVYYLYIFRDGTGKDFVPADVVERSAKVSNAPIYGYGESYIGRGLVGGHVVSLENDAKNAGAGAGFWPGKHPSKSVRSARAKQSTF